MHRTQLLWIVSLCLAAESSTPAADLACETRDDRVIITDAGRPVCEYRFADKEIPRPYFCNVHAPCGAPVTRPHPPGPDELADHPLFHPGIWLAFGDLNGADSWRLAAPIEHAGFIDAPHIDNGTVTFTVRNCYRNAANDATVCEETARWTLSAASDTYVLSLDTRFSSDQTLTFGDQEEMGLGVRLATPIAENQQRGGLLTDSTGRTTAKEIWGQPADWCDYSGTVEGRDVGMSILAHAGNPRQSRWHARDYGPFVANLFAIKAFTGEESPLLTVQPDESFRLRYQIVIHNGRPGAGYDPAAAWVDYNEH